MERHMKFQLTSETKIYLGRTLYRIEAVASFGAVNAGDLGGWVEKESNLSQVGDAWVYGDALVYGDARVSGDARVYGNAQVYGDALVYGDAWVYGNAQVSDNARVYGNAQVSGNARVSPVNIIGLTYPVTITDGHIRIGCEFHTIAEWRDFDDRRILKMEGRTAINFWRAHKAAIMSICDARAEKQEVAA